MTETPRTATGDTERASVVQGLMDAQAELQTALGILRLRGIDPDVVKAVREAMRETMDSSTFGNPHSEPAEREYDMAEHVAAAAQAALRKEWEEERERLAEELRIAQFDASIAVTERDMVVASARARDVEALTTATDALERIASPKHRMPDEWASMVAIAALKHIGEA